MWVGGVWGIGTPHPRGGWVGLAKGDQPLPPPPEVGGWIKLPLTLLPSGYSPNMFWNNHPVPASRRLVGGS
jgi:hypothetical protein